MSLIISIYQCKKRVRLFMTGIENRTKKLTHGFEPSLFGSTTLKSLIAGVSRYCRAACDRERQTR